MNALVATEAKALVDAAAFTVGEDYTDAGRRIVHSFLGGIGADWDVHAIHDLIDRAEAIYWERSILQHDLVVVAPYKPGQHARTYRFAVEMPNPPTPPPTFRERGAS